MVSELNDPEVDLAIAVPMRGQDRALMTSVGRRLLGLTGRLTLGSSDIFSGLMAVRRSSLGGVPRAGPVRGTRLVLDLLARSGGVHRDVPVQTGPGDRLGLGSLGLDDVRQLKRVLDHRFGTFSRLVQFCMVGASGMIVDLTLYALLQSLFARFWPLGGGALNAQYSWSLATAGRSPSSSPWSGTSRSIAGSPSTTHGPDRSPGSS